MWCWSWNSNTLATWCEELTHLKSSWCWERLRAGGEGDDSGWDGWMASLTQWTWVWVNSGSWWWTGRPGVLQSKGLQRVGHNWVTELNWKVMFCFLTDHHIHYEVYVMCNYKVIDICDLLFMTNHHMLIAWPSNMILVVIGVIWTWWCMLGKWLLMKCSNTIFIYFLIFKDFD